MSVTKQQLVDALTFCADGYRFPRYCPNCVLLPFRPPNETEVVCTSCIDGMLLAALEFIDDCETEGEK